MCSECLETNSMGPEAPIHEGAGNANYNTHNIGNPIVRSGVVIKAWLDEFNHAAENARTQKYW